MRLHLTYANVAATIALFVSLGGGAYAAFKLPKNSVGSAQIKPNAVRSSDVKNGSLQAGDFAAGQLPAGQPGPKGDPGQKGDQGQPGTNGHDGLAGSARAYGFILANGAVAANKNVGPVTSGGTGIYCIHLTVPYDPLTMGVLVSPQLEGNATNFGSDPSDDRTIVEWLDDNGDCSGENVLEVRTGRQNFTTGTFVGNVAAPQSFFFAVP